MKKAFRIIAAAIAAIILVLIVYVVYVFTSYYRLEDNLPLDTDGSAAGKTVPVSKELSLTSWNIGFGAYTDDFSFFMDGGEYSRGFSEETVKDTVNNIIDDLYAENSDFYMLQEVDRDSDRSYHIDQYSMISDKFDYMERVYAQNYDSPYLFYPLTEPHGKSVAGIVTMSDYHISSSLRRSLPIQSGFAKFLDLDRCYSISRLPVENGKELVLVNFHLSAYTSDPSVAESQLEMLYSDITAEYEKGNYVICGGDFNKDLLGDSSAIFGISGGDYSWAAPFPFDTIPEGFDLVVPYNENNPSPSCRNADAPWDPETVFQLTIDGFIISDNIEKVSSDVIDKNFACSDHNPVYLKFILK